MQRLADISIDLDGEEFVFRVRPDEALKTLLAKMSQFTTAHADPNVIVEIGQRRRGPDTRRDDEIAALYQGEDGLGVSAIKKKLGLAEETIKAALKRKGVTMRNQAEGCALLKRQRDRANAAGAAGQERDRLKTAVREMGLSDVADLFDEQKPPALVQPADPRSAGAPLRQQSNLAPAPERATPEKPPISSAISPTQPPPADRTAERTLAAPHNKSNAAIARAKSGDGDEIVRRYVEDRESVVSLAAVFTGGDHAQIREVLVARGVTLRTRSETQRIAWEKLQERKAAPPLEPKPKPLVIPANAPRKQVALSDALKAKEAPPEAKPKKRGEAIRELGHKIRAHSARTKGMTPAEQQDAVAKFFAEGRVITEIQTPPAVQPPRPAVGMSDGRRGPGRGR